jgi:CRISPR-associated protein Cmr1
MFLGGADNNSNPEWRAPSVRGALRYWFRALAGGVSGNDISDDNFSELQKKENQIFGSTDSRSSVSVLVLPEGQTTISQFTKDRTIKAPGGNFLPTGKNYLLWSMAETRQKPSRTYITPGSKFQIKIRAPFGEDKNIKIAAASLWLLSNLGALGSRANRGAGSFQLMLKDNMLEIPEFNLCKSIEKLQIYLKHGILKCLKVVTGETAEWRTFDNPPLYDILSP